MSRARTFSKSEIMDAARAAAETGLRVVLHKTGEMEFSHDTTADKTGQTPEGALEAWLKGRDKVS